MPKYVVVDGHKKINGKRHAPGDLVECTDEVAKQLRLEPAKEESQKPEIGSKKQEAGSQKKESKKE